MGRISHPRLAAAALVLFLGAATAHGQKAKTAAADGLSQARAALVEATEEYKAGTREMIHLKEAEVAKAEQAHEQLKALVADGLVARRELEEDALALAGKRAALEDLRKQIVDSDHLIAEVRAAEEAEREAAKQAQELARLQKAAASRARLLATARYSAGPVVIRHTGGSGWTISNLSGVQNFFWNAFGRPLPTSAVGQTATHDRLGFDHRRAVDVALHPDSVEGRALIGYLQANGITFIAFRAAVPGSATGPHIHIGPPSHKI
ncbi:MAG TPA: hypothetical protein VG148_13490 [Pyrinomonadaceae bacterium]|nr:hypothetical protein [Pyrinomonadaceae bacterium]